MTTSAGPLTLEWINIEFASLCNLRCRWCSLDHDKPREYMEPALLARILDEVIEDDGIQLQRIELHNGGETLLHPDLGAMLDVIRERKERLPEINLLTNAGALNAEKTEQILGSNAVDTIRFSVDGGTEEAFEYVRRPAKWSKIRDNIHAFLDQNETADRRIKTGVICIVNVDRAIDTEWMEPEFRALFSRIDDVSLRYPHNWDGSEELGIDDRDYRYHEQISKGKVCYFLTKDMVILPTGNVTVCCADLNGRGIIGNLENSSLREIYAAKARQEMIRKFEAGRKDDIDLCKDCTGYYM